MKIDMRALAGFMLLGIGACDMALAAAGRQDLSIGATVVAPCVIRSIPAQATCAQGAQVYKAPQRNRSMPDEALMVQSNMADNASYVEIAL